MPDIPAAELEETRAALAPTLAAVAAILPWLAKPRPLRFDSALNQRWIGACAGLAKAWADRFEAGADNIRPTIFTLYGVALESADVDVLRLGEALASAADQLEADSEGDSPSPRLIAALAACIESLNDTQGLEHPAFPERTIHFAQRLEAMAAPGAASCKRSVVLDRLFVSEANESLERMRDALALLPPDAYALKLTATELAQAAENAELFGVMYLARQLAARLTTLGNDLDAEPGRNQVNESLQQLAEAIAAVNA